jgi:Beta-lactamase enzyme family
MIGRRRPLVAGLIALLAVAAAGEARALPALNPRLRSLTWRERVADARRYAERRAGIEAFALIDGAGRIHGYRRFAVAPSASLLKPILLVTYLRKRSVRDRNLTDYERSVLSPMIRRSDNLAAEIVLRWDGARAITRFARTAKMTHFRLRLPYWGHSAMVPREQAWFFYRIDKYVPIGHRRYAMRLLSSIVPSQRWGAADVAPAGWKLYFKGGWSTGTGLVDHQSLLLARRGERIALCITTRFNPTHSYGKQTLRGIAARLLGGLSAG